MEANYISGKERPSHTTKIYNIYYRYNFHLFLMKYALIRYNRHLFVQLPNVVRC